VALHDITESLLALLMTGELLLRRVNVHLQVLTACLGKDILMGNHPGKLEVADAEVARVVAIGDQLVLYMCKKRGTPEQWGSISQEQTRHPHSRFSRIDRSNAGWHNLGKLHGLGVKVDGKQLEVI
jgi:hypothetical protein